MQAKADAMPRLGLLSRLPLTKSDGTPALTARCRSPREPSCSYTEYAPEGGLELQKVTFPDASIAQTPACATMDGTKPAAGGASTSSAIVGRRSANDLSEESLIYARLAAPVQKASAVCCALPTGLVAASRVFYEGVLHAMPAILLMCFLVLPAVSNRIFRSFACRGFTLDDADLSKWCDSPGNIVGGIRPLRQLSPKCANVVCC